MDRNERHERDSAGVGPYARGREQLVAMSTLESWTFSDGDPDIRGWDVHTVSGRQLGSVSDLLVDRDEGQVVLLDVDLPGTDRHTLVPVRVVSIDRAKRLILMDSADLPEADATVLPAQLADVVVEDEPLIESERRQLRRRAEDRIAPDR